MDNKVLAKAAGHEITEEELNLYLQNLPQEQQAYANSPQARTQILEQIIQIRLFAQYGTDLKVQDTDEYKSVMERVTTEITSQMAVTETLKGLQVSDEEVKNFYDQNPTQFTKGPEATAKHILTETEEEATKAFEEIVSGEKTFEEAATAYSTCPSKDRGGDLGTFGQGQMVPEFDQAVFSAEVGKVFGPIKTQFGYHLIRVDHLSNGETVDFDTVKDQVRQTLLQQKQQAAFEAKLKELQEKYPVERF